MSDYYGAATLEDWLGQEIFFMKNVPYFAVAKFEKYREGIERDIEVWMQNGDAPSWRDWGRGFNSIVDNDDVFNALVETAKERVFEERRVLCAANELPDGRLLLGARHWDELMHGQCNLYLKALKLKEQDVVGKVKQGFVDQWGNFLNREVAWMIADRQGQIKHTGPGFSGPELFSENLY